MKKTEYIVVPQVGVRRSRYQSVGHSVGDLLWFLDDASMIHWQVFDGKNHHHDVSSLDMDARWRGRLDKRGTATLLPPVKVYSLNTDGLMSLLPIGAMITLGHLGAKRFYLDTHRGLVRLRERRRKTVKK